MRGRILVADGNPLSVQSLRETLESTGCLVDTIPRAEQVLTRVSRTNPNLVLLSMSLAGTPDALTLCQTLPQSGARVSVIVTAYEDVRDERVRALRAGADDYIALSFTREEIHARVEAILRRREPPIEAVRLGATLVDFSRRLATAGSRRIPLTDREFEVLRYLAERRGGVVTRDELFQKVWGYSPVVLTRTVDNCILHLRRKLEPDRHHPIFIRKVYGDGYRLVPSE